MADLRPHLARVRGLGSAKEGTHHWWIQRLTAVALIPLTIWFAVSIISLAGAEYAAVRAWIKAPVPMTLLILTIVITFHHAQLGMQVVIEDYIHSEWLKIAALVVVKFLAVVLSLAAIVAIARVAFGG